MGMLLKILLLTRTGYRDRGTQVNKPTAAGGDSAVT